jgi:DNA-binding PadR family transcriptional regulator
MYRRVMQRDAARSQTRDPGLLILASLAAGPQHGYAMVEDIAAFGGARLGPGTLYGALARLEEAGLIEPLDVDERRRPYRITPAGLAVLTGEIDALERVVLTVRDRIAEIPS